jgi:hypothetical protein
MLEFEKQCYQYANRLNQCFVETPHTVSVSKYALGEQLKFDGGLTDRIVKFLLNKGVLKEDSGSVKITGTGIQYLIDYERSNDKVSFPNNYINVGSMNSSQIVQGSRDIQISITLNESQIQETKQIIASLKELLNAQELSDDKRGDLTTEVESLDIQLKTPKPKVQRIKDYLTTAKNIIEGTAIGSIIVARIETFLSTLG